MTVSYSLDDKIATITLDDGKRNALGFATFDALGAALDRAAADRAVVVLVGRDGVFSAGFDLNVLRSGPADAGRLVLAGFALAHRLYTFPAPVIVACTGHAIAMGSFLMLAADYRIGITGDFKIGANEVAIGLVMPHFAAELCRLRLAPTHVYRAVELSEMYEPTEAVAAGFLDHAVSPGELVPTTLELAQRVAKLGYDTHAATKQRLRARDSERLAAALDADRTGKLV